MSTSDDGKGASPDKPRSPPRSAESDQLQFEATSESGSTAAEAPLASNVNPEPSNGTEQDETTPSNQENENESLERTAGQADDDNDSAGGGDAVLISPTTTSEPPEASHHSDSSDENGEMNNVHHQEADDDIYQALAPPGGSSSAGRRASRRYSRRRSSRVSVQESSGAFSMDDTASLGSALEDVLQAFETTEELEASNQNRSDGNGSDQGNSDSKTILPPTTNMSRAAAASAAARASVSTNEKIVAASMPDPAMNRAVSTVSQPGAFHAHSRPMGAPDPAPSGDSSVMSGGMILTPASPRPSLLQGRREEQESSTRQGISSSSSLNRSQSQDSATPSTVIPIHQTIQTEGGETVGVVQLPSRSGDPRRTSNAFLLEATLVKSKRYFTEGSKEFSIGTSKEFSIGTNEDDEVGNDRAAGPGTNRRSTSSNLSHIEEDRMSSREHRSRRSLNSERLSSSSGFVVAETVDVEQDVRKFRRSLCLSIVAVVVVMSGIVGIILGVTLSNSNKNSGDSMDPEEPIDDLSPTDVLANVPTLICHERNPGRGESRNCNVQETIERGGAAANLVAIAGLRTFPEADIAIINSGLVDNDILPGDFRVNDANFLLPYFNRYMLFEMTGEQIVSALEQGLEHIYEDPSDSHTGAYPYAAGLRYDIDMNATMGERVAYIEVNPGLSGDPDDTSSWTLLDPSSIYTVVVNSYIGLGGDEYIEFMDVEESEVTTAKDTLVTDSFMAYAREEEELVAPPESMYSTLSYKPHPSQLREGLFESESN